MGNQECKIKPQITNINGNEPLFYSYNILSNKYRCSCNNISDLYAKLCVTDVVKNMNVRVFNIMSRSNETRHIKQHETSKCKCRLDASVCNNKKRWNNDKCRCECKELIDKSIWDTEFIWNPSNCECEWDKLCDIDQNLDYKNCTCRIKIVDKPSEQCSDGNEMIYDGTGNYYEKVCNSCTTYIVLFAIAFLIIIGISNAYFYFHRYLK